MLTAGPIRRSTAVLALVTVLALILTAPPAAAGLDPIPDDRVRERQQWVLRTLNTEAAWRITRGAGATVAVLDSGIDDEIPELRGRVTTGPDMRSPVLDQEHEPGMHGTAMASLIAGTGEGGGILGVAPQARLLSLPMIPDSPVRGGVPVPQEGIMGRDSALARAIRYAANHGADVINMSLGGYGPHPGERDAVAYALSRGVVLVAAVGNDGDNAYSRENDTSFWSFPAGYSGVIGVAAVGPGGLPARFSSDNLSVLVAAPGVDVPVALPGGGHESAEGTSGAAALVSGVVALIKSRHPGLPPEMVVRALTRSARGTPPGGYDDKVGFGVVDAAAALREADRLAGYDRTLSVPRDRYFGEGRPAALATPGPDPVRIWLYAGAVLLGLVTFCVSVVILTRRAAQDAAWRRDRYGPSPPGP